MSSSMQDFSVTSISEYYSGKTIAITGGTGFVGQLVIEKLLRCCPGIKKIFVLLRKKRNMFAEERIAVFVNLPIFIKLKMTQPNFKEKIVAVYCNLDEEGLGMDEDSVELLRNEVNVFIHSAATVRFNEPLKVAFKLNTLAVRSVLNLCRGMTSLESFVHVSTAYSYCNRSTKILEEVYQTGWDFDKLHSAMQWMTDEMIEKLTPDIVRDRPNTYTLTKAFGEEVIVKEGEGLPISIVRPSIIGASYKEPLPGWCTNLNGLTGVVVATAKGLLHFLPATSKMRVDIIPADYVVNAIIAAGWKTGLSHQKHKIPFNLSEDDHQLSKIDTVARSLDCIPEADSVSTYKRRKTIPIYHSVFGNDIINAKEICDLIVEHSHSYPCDYVFQAPSLQLTTNKNLHRLQTFLVDYIPAYCVDTLLSVFRQKPKMLRVQNRVSGMINSLHYFMNREWEWETKSMEMMQKEMSDEDQKNFSLLPHSVNWKDYVLDYVIGSKKFVLKEDDNKLPAARKRLMWLNVMKHTFQGSISWLLQQQI